MPIRALAAFALFCLATIGQAGATQVLHRPSDGEPGTLDPQKMTAADSIAIDRDLYIGLVTLSPEEQPVPGVAESWDVSPDKKIWTFHLRHDAKWSNGDKLTADDFVYTCRRLVDPKTAADDPSDLKQVAGFEAIVSGQEKDLSKLGVQALDPYTLRFTLTEPRVVFPLLLTDPQLFPLNHAAMEKWGNDWTQPGHMVSNGPYRLTSWTPQSEIVLEKNPNFFEAASVRIDEVHWINADDPEAALRRYRAGELDWVGLTRTGLPWSRANAADQLHTAPTNAVYFLFFNMSKGPLAEDIRLRQALNLATDQETIVKKVDPRGEEAAYGLVPPVVSNYTPQSMPYKSTPMPQRLQQAKDLLTAAGYGPDHKLIVTVSYPTQESSRQILLAIRQMWAPLGIDVQMENMEWQVFIGLINQRNYEIGMMGGLGSYDDYESALDNYRSDAGNSNWNAYKNPKFDELFHQGGVATDMESRRHLMEQAEQVVLSDYPLIPLDFGVRNVLLAPKIQGFVTRVVFPQSRYLSFKD